MWVCFVVSLSWFVGCGFRVFAAYVECASAFSARIRRESSAVVYHASASSEDGEYIGCIRLVFFCSFHCTVLV